MRTTLYCSLIVSALLLGCQSSKPAPTAPADETPKAAMTRYTRTLETHDTDQAVKLFHVRDAKDRQVAEAFARQQIALTKVEQAMVDKFGRDKADAAMHSIGAKTETDAAKATAKVDGDTATITFADGQASTLRRVKGVWLVPVEGSEMSDADLKSYTRETETIAGRLEDVAKQIKSGKFATAEEATKAVSKAHEMVGTGRAKE